MTNYYSCRTRFPVKKMLLIPDQCYNDNYNVLIIWKLKQSGKIRLQLNMKIIKVMK